jgi:hypothetical protein
MRTRTTWIAVMLLGVVVTSITAISCSPDSTSPVQSERGKSQAVSPQSRSLQEQYAWVGQYHNDALAYALTKVKASKRTAKYDRCKVGLAALKVFQKAYRKEGRTAIFDDLTLTDGMCEAAAAGNFGVSASLGVIGNRRPSHDISPVANDYMNQLMTQTYTVSTLPGLSFAINQIVNQASASVVPLEAAAVASAGSVEISSATYWDTNEGSWSDGKQLAYNRSTVEILPGGPVNMNDRTRRILRADVAAAIGVLLNDWWQGEAAVGKACIKAAAASFIAAVALY